MILTDRATGQPVAMGRSLAEGGEGRIHLTDRPGFLAKLYHRPLPGHAAKLAALLALPPVPGVAWPVSSLAGATGEIVGFLMPEIADALPLTILASPRLRAQMAPGFTWFYLHAAALDLARIVARLHNAGIVIGDLKPENVLIDARGRACLVDADSMQLPGHRCTVGAEGFLAPEMIGADLAGIDRRAAQDGFALGALVHVLLLGHHPFAGVWRGPGDPPGLDALVKAGHLPGLAVSPNRLGPFAAGPNILHPVLRGLIRRCFVDGHRHPEQRPGAADWAEALQAALADLVLCDAAPTHFRAASAGPCPWCARADRQQGQPFAPPPDPSTPLRLMAGELQRALAAGDLPRQAFLWAHHPMLHDDTAFGPQRPALDGLAAMLPVVERLVSLSRRAPDDAEALALAWRKLDDAGIALARAVDAGLPDRAVEAERKLDLLAALRQAFAEGIEVPEQALALRHAYEAARTAFGEGNRFLRPYAGRAAQAIRRLDALSRGDFG
ncbi:MAG: hypothetical protein KJ904_16725 [Alphaproteobacteria bacterium]|nr:hypothetical protein [Alphaproteobacteria bacterium]MBU0799170.1 hypothetical protein [Alphaproteobacteria bacterium]MBU0888801.1 hypothetical protein [Alphaproteobacteria bacterium]MBU1812480.1 hypothetical protein [Alphaproteobacteria bacterium]